MDDNRLSGTAPRLAMAATRAVRAGRGRLGQAKRRHAELAAGGDLKLGEDPVEVVADGPVRDEQLLPDFSVGQPSGRQAGDLEFLRRELVPGLGCPAVARLAGGAQFLSGFVGQRGEGKGVQGVSG